MSDTYKPQGTYNDAALSTDDLAKVNAYKSQWQNAYDAGDQSGMDAAHAGAEAIRGKYNYSGGGDGSQYIALDAEKPAAIAGATPDTLTPASSQGAYINGLYAAQEEANIQTLKSAYDHNMAAFDAQAAKIPAIYRDAANRTASADAINRANFNEYAAANGLNSGTAGQAQLAMNNKLLSEQSAIQRARAEALNDVETARTQARIDYKNAVAQAIKDGNLQKARALYDEAMRVDNSIVSTALNQAQLNYQYWQGNSQLEADYQNRLQEYNDRLKEEARAEVNAILQAGGTPSDELIAQSGYSPEYIKAMQTPVYSGAYYGGYGGGTSAASSTGGNGAAGAVGALLGLQGIKNGGINTGLNNGSKGASFESIWSRARTMFDKNATEQQIVEFLDQFSQTQLTDAGLDYIMKQLNLGKYRDKFGG